MEYYLEICLKNIIAKVKYKHFKSKSHEEFDKCKHILSSHKDIDLYGVDEAYCLYIIEHNKKFEYYLIKCEFKLVSNSYENCPCVISKLSDNKTMISWKFFLENVIDNFKDKGHTFNHIAEMHIITIANKMDTSYDFYIKHNMCALEWKVNAMINKNKNLIKKFDRNWRHPLNRIFESYRV